MLRSITGVLFVLLMTATLSAQRVPAKLPIKVRPGPVTEAGKQYRALLTEFGQQRLAYSKAYREAKTAADRVKVRQELYPQPQKLAGKFLSLAKENADDPIAVQALSWVVSNVRFGLMMQSKYAARANPAKEADVKRFAERVVKDFADLKHYRGSLGDAAKRELYEIEKLGIGKTAPEIAGEDIAGTKFKLTDYRGKVVVIDFWGNW